MRSLVRVLKYLVVGFFMAAQFGICMVVVASLFAKQWGFMTGFAIVYAFMRAVEKKVENWAEY